jgi:hypothetical protein
LKKKTPEDHPDFTVLIKAIDKVQTIANQNEAMQKEVENLQTIVTIQQRLRHVRILFSRLLLSSLVLSCLVLSCLILSLFTSIYILSI